MIKMQWLPLILNEKSTDKALVCLYEEIYLICVTSLFDLGFVLKFQFSFVIFQFHKETCSNSLIKGHLFIYCIICLQSHFVKKIVRKWNFQKFKRFQINAVHLNFLVIKESWKNYHSFHKKGSCDTEDWSNGCWKFTFAITGINYILKMLTEKTL